jgi:TetR/AcrR family transcriptional regulator
MTIDVPSSAALPPRRGRPPARAASVPQGRTSAPDMRERLLDAAADLFAERGIAGSTTAQIASRAGVTAAMVHYYFKSRASLLDAFTVERLLPFVASVWGPLDAAALRQPVSAATGLAQRILAGAEQRPWLPPLWIREIASHGGELRERMLVHLPVERMNAFARAIAAGQRRGEIQPGIEPRLVFLSVLGLTLLPLATSGVWQRVVEQPARARAALGRHVHTLLVHALQAR